LAAAAAAAAAAAVFINFDLDDDALTGLFATASQLII